MKQHCMAGSYNIWSVVVDAATNVWRIHYSKRLGPILTIHTISQSSLPTVSKRGVPRDERDWSAA